MTSPEALVITVVQKAKCGPSVRTSSHVHNDIGDLDRGFGCIVGVGRDFGDGHHHGQVILGHDFAEHRVLGLATREPVKEVVVHHLRPELCSFVRTHATFLLKEAD